MIFLLFIISLQVLEGLNEVSLERSLLQAEHPQLHQPVFAGEALQPSEHPGGPMLSTFWISNLKFESWIVFLSLFIWQRSTTCITFGDKFGWSPPLKAIDGTAGRSMAYSVLSFSCLNAIVEQFLKRYLVEGITVPVKGLFSSVTYWFCCRQSRGSQPGSFLRRAAADLTQVWSTIHCTGIRSKLEFSHPAVRGHLGRLGPCFFLTIPIFFFFLSFFPSIWMFFQYNFLKYFTSKLEFVFGHSCIWRELLIFLSTFIVHVQIIMFHASFMQDSEGTPGCLFLHALLCKDVAINFSE